MLSHACKFIYILIKATSFIEFRKLVNARANAIRNVFYRFQLFICSCFYKFQLFMFWFSPFVCCIHQGEGGHFLPHFCQQISCTTEVEISALMLAFRQLIACSTIFRNGEYGCNIRRCTFSFGCSGRRCAGAPSKMRY